MATWPNCFLASHHGKEHMSQQSCSSKWQRGNREGWGKESGTKYTLHSHCPVMINVVNLTGSRIILETNCWASVREFLDWPKWDGKAHPKCGYHHFISEGPGSNNKEKASWATGFPLSTSWWCDQLWPWLITLTQWPTSNLVLPLISYDLINR